MTKGQLQNDFGKVTHKRTLDLISTQTVRVGFVAPHRPADPAPEAGTRLASPGQRLHPNKIQATYTKNPAVGTAVWTRVDEWPWWPAVVVNREEAEAQVAEDLVSKFPKATSANVMVGFGNWENIVDVVKISRIAEFTRNIGLMRNGDNYAEDVINAANEARKWIIDEGNETQERVVLVDYAFKKIWCDYKDGLPRAEDELIEQGSEGDAYSFASESSANPDSNSGSGSESEYIPEVAIRMSNPTSKQLELPNHLPVLNRRRKSSNR